MNWFEETPHHLLAELSMETGTGRRAGLTPSKEEQSLLVVCWTIFFGPLWCFVIAFTLPWQPAANPGHSLSTSLTRNPP